MDDGLETLLKLLMMIGGLVIFSGGVWSARDSFLIQLRKGVATGRVVTARFVRRRGSDSDREAHVLISFETPDQKVVRFEQPAPGGFFTVHSEESMRSLGRRNVDVYYDRKNPERASITPMRDYFWGLFSRWQGSSLFSALQLVGTKLASHSDTQKA